MKKTCCKDKAFLVYCIIINIIIDIIFLKNYNERNKSA